MRILLAAMALGAYFLAMPGGQVDRRPSGSNRLIDALTSASELVRYVEDGMANMSVLDGRSSEVKAIVSLGADAIPLLIAHLDDTRLTSATFNGGFTSGTPIRVPVGYVCLDILLEIVADHALIFVKDCADDGLGACVKREYYFRPDEYYPVGSNDYLAREGVRVAKQNWERAYRTGLLRFQQPVRWGKRARQ